MWCHQICDVVCAVSAAQPKAVLHCERIHFPCSVRRRRFRRSLSVNLSQKVFFSFFCFFLKPNKVNAPRSSLWSPKRKACALSTHSTDVNEQRIAKTVISYLLRHAKLGGWVMSPRTDTHIKYISP